MRDGIRSRAARLARVLERKRRGPTGFGNRYRSVAYRFVRRDGAPALTALGNGGVTTFDDDADDVMRIDFVMVEPGQFLPHPSILCDDGTPIPYDVLDKDGIEMWRAQHPIGEGGMVFLDKDRSEALSEEYRKWLLTVNPPREFGEIEEANSSNESFVDDVSASKFLETHDNPDADEEPKRLSPELETELAEFEVELEEHRKVNPIETVRRYVQSWLPKEPKLAEPMSMPKVVKANKRIAAPPPGTAWAALLEANKRKRAEYEDRKQAAVDERRANDAKVRRQTQVTP